MAEGAKMAGASQGTAQQRAFTQEGVKGGRKGYTHPEMADLPFFFYSDTCLTNTGAQRISSIECT